MQLPGGLFGKYDQHQTQTNKEWAFSTITGGLELAILESGFQHHRLTSQITEVLSHALDHVGFIKATKEVVKGLSVGDRQFLLFQLATRLSPGKHWLTGSCAQCDEIFQANLQFADLPVKQAPDEYPIGEVSTSIGMLRVRVPNGSDQEAVAHATDEIEAQNLLLARLLTHSESGKTEVTIKVGAAQEAKQKRRIAALTTEDLQKIDQMLEYLSPEVTRRIETHCPSCGGVNQLTLSPYHVFEGDSGSLLNDVHTLASHYHWPESEILSMPRRRRLHYLKLIDRSRNSLDAETFINAQLENNYSVRLP